jgi:hypothetical protein
MQPTDETMIRRSHLRSVEAASVEVVFLFVIPIVLLYFHIIPVNARIMVLLLVSLFMYGIIRKQGWRDTDVGLTFQNIRKGIPMYTIATALAAIAIIATAHFMGLQSPERWWTNPHFLFMFVVVSFFQEFAFRGFLMPLLHKIFPDTFTIILVNALLFSGMHAIYPFPALGLPFSFAAGLFFAILYRKHPNLILVSASHSILNFLVVWYGVFVIPH